MLKTNIINIRNSKFNQHISRKNLRGFKSFIMFIFIAAIVYFLFFNASKSNTFQKKIFSRYNITVETKRKTIKEVNGSFVL